MSVRVTWASAQMLGIEVAEQGTEIGEDTVDDRAIVLGGDDIFVIEGSTEELASLAERMTAAIATPAWETVTFKWSTEMGRCYECGNPAAYTSDEHTSSPENLRCSVCAALDAAHGSTIVYLFDEREGDDSGV